MPAHSFPITRLASTSAFLEGLGIETGIGDQRRRSSRGCAPGATNRGRWSRSVAPDAHLQRGTPGEPSGHLFEFGDVHGRPDDPRRYGDATKVPYLVLGNNLKDLIAVLERRKGDLTAVFRVSDASHIVFAIFADVGPRWGIGHVPGEGSIALAQALGHEPT